MILKKKISGLFLNFRHVGSYHRSGSDPDPDPCYWFSCPVFFYLTYFLPAGDAVRDVLCDHGADLHAAPVRCAPHVSHHEGLQKGEHAVQWRNKRRPRWRTVLRVRMFLASWIRSRSISQRYGSGSFYYQAKLVRKTLIPTVKSGNFVTFFAENNFFLQISLSAQDEFFW